MPGKEMADIKNGGAPGSVAEFCQVHGELARLRERFYRLRAALAAPCPVCRGSGRVTQRMICRTCGGKGQIFPLFSVESRLVYQDNLGNLVELDTDGNDVEWPDALQRGSEECED